MTQSRIYSNDILVALAKRAPMNCRQIAGQISHDMAKTVALVAYMRINGKLQTASEKVDGMAAYVLTPVGEAAAERLAESSGADDTREASAKPATVAPTSAQPLEIDRKIAAAPERTNSPPAAATKNDPHKPRVTKTNAQSMDLARVRLGVLNTGELMIWPEGHPPALLNPADVTALRAFLVASA